jgi:hypothetical protein
MNILLWALQVIAALVYTASGVMKVFMFDSISHDVRSFDALPRKAWLALGILELVCVVGLIAPGAPGVARGVMGGGAAGAGASGEVASSAGWPTRITAAAAALLAMESLVFIAVHAKYREIAPIILSAALGLLMVFIAYGRLALRPIG